MAFLSSLFGSVWTMVGVVLAILWFSRKSWIAGILSGYGLAKLVGYSIIRLPAFIENILAVVFIIYIISHIETNKGFKAVMENIKALDAGTFIVNWLLLFKPLSYFAKSMWETLKYIFPLILSGWIGYVISISLIISGLAQWISAKFGFLKWIGLTAFNVANPQWKIVAGIILLSFCIFFSLNKDKIRVWFEKQKEKMVHGIAGTIGGTKIGMFLLEKVFPNTQLQETEEEAERMMIEFAKEVDDLEYIERLIARIKDDFGREAAITSLIEFIEKNKDRNASEKLMKSMIQVYMQEEMVAIHKKIEEEKKKRATIFHPMHPQEEFEAKEKRRLEILNELRSDEPAEKRKVYERILKTMYEDD